MKVIPEPPLYVCQCEKKPISDTPLSPENEGVY
jgi:hypothetical protein